MAIRIRVSGELGERIRGEVGVRWGKEVRVRGEVRVSSC